MGNGLSYYHCDWNYRIYIQNLHGELDYYHDYQSYHSYRVVVPFVDDHNLTDLFLEIWYKKQVGIRSL